MKDNEVIALALVIFAIGAVLLFAWQLIKMQMESEKYEDAFAAQALKATEDKIFGWHEQLMYMPEGHALTRAQVTDEIARRFPEVFEEPFEPEAEPKMAEQIEAYFMEARRNTPLTVVEPNEEDKS